MGNAHGTCGGEPEEDEQFTRNCCGASDQQGPSFVSGIRAEPPRDRVADTSGHGQGGAHSHIRSRHRSPALMRRASTHMQAIELGLQA